MPVSKPVIAAVAVLGVAATLSASALVAQRLIRRRMTEGAAILNETLPINSKWWRDRAKKPGEIMYVALGDSAAQGIGASAPHRSYVGMLARHIKAETGRSVALINLGISGATVAHAVAEQVPGLQALTPDIVTVCIGANDIAAFDAEAFERDLNTVFAALPEHAIVSDLPYFYLPHNERTVAVANQILRELAAQHALTVVPLHATMKRHGVWGMLTHFARDLFHPNDRGYAVWASAFEPALDERLAALAPEASAS